MEALESNFCLPLSMFVKREMQNALKIGKDLDTKSGCWPLRCSWPRLACAGRAVVRHYSRVVFLAAHELEKLRDKHLRGGQQNEAELAAKKQEVSRPPGRPCWWLARCQCTAGLALFYKTLPSADRWSWLDLMP